MYEDHYPHYGQVPIQYNALKGLLKSTDLVSTLLINCQKTYGTEDYILNLSALATKLAEIDKYIYFKGNEYQKFGESFYSKTLFLYQCGSADEYKDLYDCEDYETKFSIYRNAAEVVGHILSIKYEMCYIPEWASLIDNLLKSNKFRKEILFNENEDNFIPVYIRKDGTEFNLFEGKISDKFHNFNLFAF